MKLAIVSPIDYPCGIGLYAENIVREWRREGHEVWCLADEAPPEHLRGEFPDDMTIRCWRRGEGYSGVPGALRRLQPDLVNIQFELSFCPDPEEWDGLLQQAQSICPVVVTYHSWPQNADSRVRKDLLTRNPRPDAILLTSPKAYESAIEEGWSPERVSFVPHATVHPLSPPLEEINHRIVTWGFLSGSKGYGEALEALRRLLCEFPDASLTIHGALLPSRATGQIRYLRE